MVTVLKMIALSIIGFSAGVVISAGVFAFISVLGIVPRLVERTHTETYALLYEDSIMIGGIFGGLNIIAPIHIHVGIIGLIIFGLFSGMFIGCIAVSIAEVLDVIPVLLRRIHLETNLAYFMITLAVGKTIGSLVYFVVNGFAKYK
jgi:stage V sporulation protein AB